MFNGIEVGSVTVIVNDSVEVFPAVSVAVQVIVVTPIEKLNPDSGEHAGMILINLISLKKKLNAFLIKMVRLVEIFF